MTYEAGTAEFLISADQWSAQPIKPISNSKGEAYEGDSARNSLEVLPVSGRRPVRTRYIQ